MSFPFVDCLMFVMSASISPIISASTSSVLVLFCVFSCIYMSFSIIILSLLSFPSPLCFFVVESSSIGDVAFFFPGKAGPAPTGVSVLRFIRGLNGLNIGILVVLGVLTVDLFDTNVLLSNHIVGFSPRL